MATVDDLSGDKPSVVFLCGMFCRFPPAICRPLSPDVSGKMRKFLRPPRLALA